MTDETVEQMVKRQTEELAFNIETLTEDLNRKDKWIAQLTVNLERAREFSRYYKKRYDDNFVAQAKEIDGAITIAFASGSVLGGSFLAAMAYMVFLAFGGV